MKKQVVANNHYVPQMYLGQWTSSPAVPTYSLLVPHVDYPKWTSRALSGIAKRQHLYTYLVDGLETDEHELWLNAEFETPGIEAIRRVVNEGRMSPDHWKDLVRFAFLQDIRTPASYRRFTNQLQGFMPEVMQQVLEDAVKYFEVEGASYTSTQDSLFEPISFPSKIITEPGDSELGTLQLQASIGRKIWLWNMRRMLTTVIHRIPVTDWTILHAPPGVTWPTTDNPLVKLKFTSPTVYGLNGGWGVKNGDLMMPISPKHLLFKFIGNRRRPRGSVVDIATARRIRQIILENADRYVFNATEDSDIELLRPRTVSAELYTEERAAWDDWRASQALAEREIGS